MKEEKFCAVDDLQVIIPYRDFEKVMEMARNYDNLITRFTQVENQLDAVRSMYREALEKIADINRML